MVLDTLRWNLIGALRRKQVSNRKSFIKNQNLFHKNKSFTAYDDGVGQKAFIFTK